MSVQLVRIDMIGTFKWTMMRELYDKTGIEIDQIDQIIYSCQKLQHVVARRTLDSFTL